MSQENSGNFFTRLIPFSSATKDPAKEAEDIPPRPSPQRHDEAIQNEHSMLVILKESRRRFMERGLIGTIEVSASIGIFTSTISCDITASTETTEDKAKEDESHATTKEEIANLKMMERITLSYLDGVMVLLEGRAKAYKTLPFADDVSLSNGVYIADPIFGSISFAITLTATVASILAKKNTA